MTAKIYTFALSTLFIFTLTFAIIVPQTHAQFLSTQQQFSALQDGDLIRVNGEVDVYIVKIINGKYFKRLILNPEIFNSYGHLRWDNIQQVVQSVANNFQTSNLVKEVYPDGRPVNNNVYALFPNQDTGVKRLVVGGYYDPDSVYSINHLEAGESFYPTGEPITLNNAAQPEPQVQEPQVQAPSTTPVYTNKYLLNNAIQNTARKRNDCSNDLLGLESVIGDKLLIPDDVCIQYVLSPESMRDNRVLGAYKFNEHRGIVEMYTDKIETPQQKQHTLVHELCHANQHYHLQRHSTYDWNNTPAGQQFIAITRYSYNAQQVPHYKLPTNSIFLGKYGEHQPVELAADVCAMLLIPPLSTHRYTQSAINTIISNADILNWFNAYVLYSSTSPQPIEPIPVQPLTQQQKQEIYNDIDFIMNMLVNQIDSSQAIFRMITEMLMSYNEQAQRYVFSILPELHSRYTITLLTDSNQVLQQQQALQDELHRFGSQIEDLKNRISLLRQLGDETNNNTINNLVNQHNALVEQYNALIPHIQEKTTQAQTIREYEIQNARVQFIVQTIQQWLNQLIEVGEV